MIIACYDVVDIKMQIVIEVIKLNYIKYIICIYYRVRDRSRYGYGHG